MIKRLLLILKKFFVLSAIVVPFVLNASLSSSTIVNVYPSCSIQTAINGANNGDIIILELGIYTENIDFLGKSITIKSTDPNDSKVVANTIIFGDQAQVISVVTFDNGEGNDSVLSGVNIQNGSRSGIYCRNCSPTINKCIIKKNHATNIPPINLGYLVGGGGGGIMCLEGSPIITDCIIRENTARYSGDGFWEYHFGGGGGIYCSGGAPIINNCIIQENVAYGYAGTFPWGFTNMNGGGIYVRGNSSAVITNCEIHGNLVGYNNTCGGIYCDDSSPTINNCVLSNNDKTGIYFQNNSSASVTNCFFSNNGSGICFKDNSSANITNCILSHNNGRGISLYDNSSAGITHCTISGNKPSSGGGIYCIDSPSLTVTNCILWNNASPQIYHESSTLIVNYSDIQGDYSGGTGNIDSNPLFIDPNVDFHLQCASPCIDKGTAVGLPTHDTDGVSRPQDGDNDGVAKNDMGAYEVIYVPGCTVYYRDQDNDGYGLSSDIRSQFAPEGEYRATQGGDCDDSDDTVYPGAAELCDGKDNDCNGETPSDEADADGDGYRICDNDCDDEDSATYPGALELCNDKDNDCDGMVPPQLSFWADQTTGTDPLTVAFETTPLTGAAFSWDFGDEATGTGPTVSHTYTHYGSYDVTLIMSLENETCSLIHYSFINVRSSQVTKEVRPSCAPPCYTSIQEAIKNADEGEIILVHDGTYKETINFMGKTITLRSENGPGQTIINGNEQACVVTFNHNEGPHSLLHGFTLYNGLGATGGGILCQASSPTISNCRILNNRAEVLGGGIYGYNSSARIINCLLQNNKTILEEPYQVCLGGDSGTYINIDIDIFNSSHDHRTHIQKYTKKTGKWASRYRLFGSPCGTTPPLHMDDFLFISFLP